MKLLAIGRPRPGIDAAGKIARHAEAELEHLWRMYVDGLVREMYSPGGTGIVLILEAASVAAGASALSKLPLVANEVIEFEIVDLRWHEHSARSASPLICAWSPVAALVACPLMLPRNLN